MGTWTSLVVLSLAVVSTLSFPRPDTEYKIPKVGLRSRAQYYVLHSDGTYKYGYDSGDGLYEQSMAKAPGEVTGAFGYTDASGQHVKLEYTADERGFLPRGSHLPVAPEGDFGSRVRAASSPTATVRGSAASLVPPSSSPVAFSAPVEVANIRSSAGGDGSYSFGYETSSSSRSESADAHNSVTGQYAFTADDGVNRAINYIAGSQTGYIAEGDSLPVGPAVPGAESGIPTGRILPILSEDEANALAAATSGGATSYAAGTSTTKSGSPSIVPSTKSVPTGSSDASYSFSYDAEESARSETADTNLNIQGTYSFVSPEGHRLAVNYVAGSDTGFVATGDHLPVAPDTGSSSTLTGDTTATGVTTYSASSPVKTAATYSASAPAAPVEVAQVRSATGDDGSYSFGYETSSSSRSESASAQNAVTGQYAFVADDGINRAIKYTADAEKGYIAEGDSLPRGPPVPGAESGIPTGRIYPILSEEEANALAAATSGSASSTTYTASSSSDSVSSDASYSFQYDAEDVARQETADADLNIQGSYSFVPLDGHRLTVNYIAGSDTGFVATGDHLPVGPEVAAVPHSAPSPTSSSAFPSPAAPAAQSSFSAPSSIPAASTKIASTKNSDASYSFSYDAGDSSRSESADGDLNVEGTYSFIPPDGHRHTVNYVAGSDTGFVATGDHLPVAPEAAAPPSQVRGASTAPAVATYSAASPAAATPVEVAQVRSSSAGDGSYNFAYETSSSSRSESADARNSVTGHYAFVADDGINRKINYIAGSETGYIAEGDSLPIGPPVPGAESGIPTGRITPVLSEDEANALAAASSASAAAPLLKASQSGQTSATPADASYSFSFISDSYSRNEEADADGNVVGSYTFLDEHGKEHTIDFVAGRETGFLPEGFPTLEEYAGTAQSIPTGPSSTSTFTSHSTTGSSSAATKTDATRSSAAAAQVKYFSPAQRTSSTTGHTSQIIGDVLLHRYDAANRDKYGYVFTALRR